MKKFIFFEKQRFTQWWIWLLLVVTLIVVLAKPIANNNLSESFIPLSILLLVVLLFIALQLNTKIDEQGIHIKMFPFHFSYVLYPWEKIKNVRVRKYNPLMEYGGWGVRFGSNGKAFNVKGNKGIEIRTTSGDHRMIGTQKMEEAQQVIDYYLNKESATKE